MVSDRLIGSETIAEIFDVARNGSRGARYLSLAQVSELNEYCKLRQVLIGRLEGFEITEDHDILRGDLSLFGITEDWQSWQPDRRLQTRYDQVQSVLKDAKASHAGKLGFCVWLSDADW